MRNRMGSEEFVHEEQNGNWGVCSNGDTMRGNENKINQGLKDSEKKFNYLVSEIYLQTNDCLGPEGNGKHKQNEVRQDSDASCCLGFKFYLHSFSAVPRG